MTGSSPPVPLAPYTTLGLGGPAARFVAADTESELVEAFEESLFSDQNQVASHEQQHFERNMKQIERYVEDQVLVLRRRHEDQAFFRGASPTEAVFFDAPVSSSREQPFDGEGERRALGFSVHEHRTDRSESGSERPVDLGLQAR